MKIVVTGASGFLGHWLVKSLAREGHEVHCLIRNSKQSDELSKLSPEKNIFFSLGDVTNLDSVQKAFQSAEAVFHLAGVIAYKKSERSLMDEVNVGGTDHVIRACRDNKVKKLIHISSVTAIGAGFKPTEILNENSKYNLEQFNMGYFETKRISEENVVAATKRGDIDSVILNPSTIYGRGDASKGSRSAQVKVAQGKFPFYTVGGASIIHVEDTVFGILSGWKKGRSGERYILCGENLTVQQLFTEIANCAGVKPPRFCIPTPLLFTLGALGDLKTALGKPGSLSIENARKATMYHWFSHEKATRELGLQPRPAREAIRDSVEGMRDLGLLRTSI